MIPFDTLHHCQNTTIAKVEIPEDYPGAFLLLNLAAVSRVFLCLYFFIGLERQNSNRHKALEATATRSIEKLLAGRDDKTHFL